MTILSTESLINFLDLIADGASVVEATTAIGGAPKSKIAFAWIADSEAASEFGSPPDPASKWTLEWNGSVDWFDMHYRTAREDGRVVRTIRKSPIRADLEKRLAVKRATVSNAPVYSDIPIRADLEERLAAKRAGAAPVMVAPPPPPNPNVVRVPPNPIPRPSYAFKRAAPIDGAQGEFGPPTLGRFTVATKRYSQAERLAGTVSVSDEGLKQY
jgi:hypothetical protein